MYSNIKTTNTLRKAPRKPLPVRDPWKQGVFFIPMMITGGFLCNTDSGQVNLNDIDVEDTSWKELIATGDGDLQTLWEDSVSIQTAEEKMRYHKLDGTVSSEVDTTTHGIINYHVGKHFFGFSSSSTSSFDIVDNPSYNGFNTIVENSSFDLIVYADELPYNVFNRFRFYCFPENNERKIYYISNLEKHWNPNDKTHIESFEITFTRVSNKVQKSGKAIEEYFHNSCIGGSYPWPVLDRGNKKIILDDNKMEIKGACYVNEEFYNASIHNNSAFIGWEVIEDDTPEWVGQMKTPIRNEDGTFSQKFFAPKVIHQSNFAAGDSYILNRRAIPESDIVFLNKLNFTENKYTTWKAQWENTFSGDFDTKYQGECSYSYRKNMASFYDLNDKLATKDNLTDNYSQTGVANGYVNINLEEVTLKELTWADVNMFNYYCNRDIITLPFAFENHVLNQPKQWGLVGAILDFFLCGFPGGWSWTQRRITHLDGDTLVFDRDICGITSQSLIDIAQKNWNEKDAQSIFLNDFYAKDTSDRFNVNNRTLAMSSTLCDTLTYTNTAFNTKQLSNIEINTSILGQTYALGSTDTDGTRNMYNILTNYEKFLADTTNTRIKPLENKLKKFVICGISNKNFGAESMRYTFKDENKNNIWSGSFLTNSNFRNTSRDWSNDFYCNFFNILDFSGSKIQYPIRPEREAVINNPIDIDYNETIYNKTTYSGIENSWDSHWIDLSGFCLQRGKSGDYNYYWEWKNLNRSDAYLYFLNDGIKNFRKEVKLTGFGNDPKEYLNELTNRIKNKKVNINFGHIFMFTDRFDTEYTSVSNGIAYSITGNTITTSGDYTVIGVYDVKKAKTSLNSPNYNFDLCTRKYTLSSSITFGNGYNTKLLFRILNFSLEEKSCNVELVFQYHPNIGIIANGDITDWVPNNPYGWAFFKPSKWDGFNLGGKWEYYIKTDTTFKLNTFLITNEEA